MVIWRSVLQIKSVEGSQQGPGATDPSAISNITTLYPFLCPSALMGSCTVPSVLPSAFLPEQQQVLPQGLTLRALVRGTEFQVFKQCCCRDERSPELLSKTKCHSPRKCHPCWSHCYSSRSNPNPSQDQGVRMSCGSALGLPGSGQPSFQIGHAVLGVTWSGLFE